MQEQDRLSQPSGQKCVLLMNQQRTPRFQFGFQSQYLLLFYLFELNAQCFLFQENISSFPLPGVVMI